MEEIIRNIYRIPVPLPDNPLRELNAYLIRGQERSLLIDTGFRRPECRQALEEGLRRIGADRETLDVLCTHIHTDHTGLSDLVVGPGRQIYIGEGDYPMTRRGYDAIYWAEIDRRFIREGFPPAEVRRVTGINPARTLAPPLDCPLYRTLTHGDRLGVGEYELEILHVPGHTPGQLCLWIESEGVMFTADHVLFDITPNIAMWPNLKNALGHYLESLRRIRAYPVRLALPGHRHRDALNPRIDALLEHHRRRVAETLEIVRESPGLTAYEIAARMSWDIRAKDWAHFPLTQKWFAVGEALAHLEYLFEQGRVRRRTSGVSAALYYLTPKDPLGSVHTDR